MGTRTKREWFLLISLLAAIFVIYVLLNARRYPWRSGARVEELVDDPPHIPRGDPPRQIAGPSPRLGRQPGGTVRSLSSREVSRRSSSRYTTPRYTVSARPSIRPANAPTEVNDQRETRKREEKCRRILENIYNDSFPRKRPKFLRNPKTGKNLELDGYNERLGIAFEHNGWQHYKKRHAFSKSKEEREEQKYHDDLKIARCRAVGVHLIIIPEDVPEEQLEEYIRFYLPEEIQRREQLRARGWAVPQRPFETPTQRGYSPPAYEEDTHLSGITSADHY